MTLDYGTTDGSKPTGAHCCRAFTLFWTFDDLVESYRVATTTDAKTFVRPATGQKMDLPLDITTLAPMVRLVGVCDRNPLAGDKYREPRKVWRCAHQRDDYLCAIYDRRPQMCRTYPKNQKDGRCQYVHCQSVDCPAYEGKATDET